MTYRIINSRNIVGNILSLDEELKGVYKLTTFYGTNAFYNVTSSNNKIYYNVDGTDASATLTEGAYTSTTLASEIAENLGVNIIGINETFLVTYGTETGKYQITTEDDNALFYFTFGTNTTNSARKLLGFNEEDGTAGSSVESDNVISLSPHPVIYMNIKEDYNKKIRGQNHFSASLMLWDTSSLFGEAFRMNLHDNAYNSQFVKFNGNKQLQISFYNDNYKEVSFNGTNWVLILQHISLD